MARLTMEQIARDNKNCEVSSTTSIQLSSRALSDVSCLGNFKNLERLDLSFNCLSSLEGLSSCISLKWLSVAENKLATLKGIEGLSNLMVLNAGKNKLRSIDEISSLTNLRALILNDNNISSICKLDQLKHLNTLVLSRNPVQDIGDSLMKLNSITKLSLSYCQLQTIGASLASCVDLKEARFAHNKITTIPNELVKNAGIQILDMGNNLIENWSELKVLSALHNLKNLNLQGNPIAEKDTLAKKGKKCVTYSSKLVHKVKKLVPNLRILNGKPLEKTKRSEKFSGEDTLFASKDDPSIHNGFDVKAGKEVKRKKSKTDVKASLKNISEESTEEVHALHSSSNVEVGKEPKRKKSKTKDLSIPMKDSISSYDALGPRAAKKLKSKKTDNDRGTKFEEIDDVEAPFVDLILSNKTCQDSDREKKNQGVSHDAKLLDGLVVEHKKMKKAKTIGTGQLALQLLPPTSEVGMGGPSTWG